MKKLLSILLIILIHSFKYKSNKKHQYFIAHTLQQQQQQQQKQQQQQQKQQQQQQKQQQQQQKQQQYKRLSKRLISDMRSNQDDKIEFIKSKEDYEKYNIENEKEKAQQIFEQYPRGRDHFGNSYIGDFYMIRLAYGGSRQLIGMYSFFINEYSLYYTNRTAINNNNYRNIMGSVPINKMIRIDGQQEKSSRLENEEIEIKKGNCCEFIGRVKLLIAPPGQEDDEYIVGNVMDKEYFGILQDKQLVFKWQSMTCFEIKYRFGTNNDINNPAKMIICSQNFAQIVMMRQKVVYSIVSYVMHKVGIYEFNFMMESSEDRMMSMTEEYRVYKEWSYSEIRKWPKECSIDTIDSRIRSPLYINQYFFDLYIQKIRKDKLKLAISKDQAVKEQLESILDDRKDKDKVGYQYAKAVFDDLMVTEKINWNQEQIENSDNKNSDTKTEQVSIVEIKKEDLYSYHPTYSFRGLHENMILGHLGRFSLEILENILGVDKGVQEYIAFGMRFKLPGEHQIDGYLSNAEIQVLMTKADQQDYKKISKIVAIGKGYAVEQFAQGYNENHALKAEKDIIESTDLILSIPIVFKNDNRNTALFLHYLNHEQWFETEMIGIDEQSRFDDNQKLKIVSKDLESAKMQDMKSLLPQGTGDDEYEKVEWENICYPGSIACLFKQIRTQKSFFWYKGTSTMPPCKQKVEYVVLKNPIVVSNDDYQQLKQNMYQFRDDKVDNVNKYPSVMNYAAVENKYVIRQMDLEPISCDDSAFLRAYIRNVVLQTRSSQTTSMETSELTTSESISYYIKREEHRQEQIRKEYQEAVKKSENWQYYFVSHSLRYMRRLYWLKYLQNRLNDLKNYLDSDDPNDNWNIYNLERNGANYDDGRMALVMVHGQVQQLQKLSVKHISKIEKVVKKHEKYTSQQTNSSTNSQTVKISFKKLSQQQGTSSDSVLRNINVQGLDFGSSTRKGQQNDGQSDKQDQENERNNGKDYYTKLWKRRRR